MENIQTFVTFCEAYGVPRTSLFQTVDLFEGRNMAQVLSCIQQLGSEVRASKKYERRSYDAVFIRFIFSVFTICLTFIEKKYIFY